MIQPYLIIVFLCIIALTIVYARCSHPLESFANPPRKKLAFCFLIIDKINHADLWYRFFQKADPDTYTIYIHYKHDTDLGWFNQFKIRDCVPTRWGDVSLIHAHNLLFRRALLDDVDNYKFIMLSNSCIPVKSFAHIYHTLTSNSNGHFNIADPSTCFPKCNFLLLTTPKKYIQKSSQWFILNRPQAEIVTRDTTIDERYTSIFAPEEHYFISKMYQDGQERNLTLTPNLAGGATTFTNWSDMGHPWPPLPEDRQPKNYDSITDEELEYLLQSDSLFARKFNSGCDLARLIV